MHSTITLDRVIGEDIVEAVLRREDEKMFEGYKSDLEASRGTPDFVFDLYWFRVFGSDESCCREVRARVWRHIDQMNLSESERAEPDWPRIVAECVADGSSIA